MAEVKLRALGLREVDFGDFDRYLTALTEDGRRIEILCKNARRGKKQNPAARQLCYSEFILSDRGGRYTLRDADLVHSFFALAGDIERYALSCYLNELTTALTVPDFDNPALCRLLLYALYALEGGKRDPELVKAAFEWRIMAERLCAGFNLVRRVRRGDREPAGVLFRSGGHSRGRKVRGKSRRLCTACGQYSAGNASCADSRAEQGVCVRTQRTRQRAVLQYGGGICQVPPRTRVRKSAVLSIAAGADKITV